MEQPHGYVVPGKERKVCRLRRSLYGLKQAGRCWYRDVDTFFSSVGLRRSWNDECAYVYQGNHNNKSVLLIVLVYVNNFGLACSDRSYLNHIKNQLASRFKIKDMGPIGEGRSFLGMNIYRDREKRLLWVDQSKHVRKTLVRFGMLDCNPLPIPLSPDIPVTSTMSDSSGKKGLPMGLDKPADQSTYRGIIGMLLWLISCTRWDISHAVIKLSQYSNDPRQGHLILLKKILRYLAGTMHHGIHFGGPEATTELRAWSDADWANNTDDRKSFLGYVVTFGRGPVDWKCKKSDVVATSSTEAEYQAMAAAAKHIVWARQLLFNFKSRLEFPTPLHVDNKPAVDKAKDPHSHDRTKHMAVKHHYIRERIAIGDIRVNRISTHDQLANIFTKPLSRPKFEEFVRRIGLHVRDGFAPHRQGT